MAAATASLVAGDGLGGVAAGQRHRLHSLHAPAGRVYWRIMHWGAPWECPILKTGMPWRALVMSAIYMELALLAAAHSLTPSHLPHSALQALGQAWPQGSCTRRQGSWQRARVWRWSGSSGWHSLRGMGRTGALGQTHEKLLGAPSQVKGQANALNASCRRAQLDEKG